MAGSAVSSLGIPSRTSVRGVCLLLDARLAKRSAAKWPPLMIAAAIQFCPTASLLSKFSCSLALELFSEGNSLSLLKLFVSFLKTAWDRLSAFLDKKILQLVKLIVKSKAVEATFFAVPNRAFVF